MEIVKIGINEITPYPGNAREHSEKDLDAIASSIKEFGFNDPVAIWGEKNMIVEGHGRWQAAKMLGMEELPCIRLDQLSDEERRAYTIAHNSTAELSGWDFSILESELSAITHIDMTAMGFENMTFNEDELERFFSDEPDDVPPKRIQCPKCGEWFEV